MDQLYINQKKEFLVFFVINLLVYAVAFGQNTLIEKDFIGTWKADIHESRMKSMDAMFDGATIILNADLSFSGTVMDDISGTWEMKEGSLHLYSADMPGPIILSELSKDSCMWNMKKFRTNIPFFREQENPQADPQAEEIAFVHVKKEELIGRWINRQIQDLGKTEAQNKLLNEVHFGDTNTNNYLELEASGKFTFHSSFTLRRKDKISTGNWALHDGVLSLEFATGRAEKLGITKYTSDSLILIDVEEVSLGGRQTQIRFTFTK